MADAFAEVYRRVCPTRRSTSGRRESALDLYPTLFTRAADGIRRDGRVRRPGAVAVRLGAPYTRDEWLDQLPTGGDAGQLPPAQLEEVLAGIGAAIDALGGGFTMRYAAVVVTAARTGTA